MDEPLSNLDAQLRVYMRSELTAIQRRVGITTVFVTHDQEEAMSISDRIAVMNAGVLEQMDAPEEIYARPATLFVATFIGTMSRLDATFDPAGWLRAGPFLLPVPSGVSLRAGQTVVVGIRPEDLELSADTDGTPARVESDIDLGHYRRVTLSVDGAPLLAFVPKVLHPEPLASPTVRARRVLVYADGRLAGVIEPPEGAGDRTAQAVPVVVRRQSLP
jgi:ABC-type sugar transport system ATPase subunit